MRTRLLSIIAALACAFALPAHAQFANGDAAIPDAVDTPYPAGDMTLSIDASDVSRGIYKVRQIIPVTPGTRSLTLLFPQWLPGNHGPRGPIAELIGLRFVANGAPVIWRRDPIDINAFHLQLPAGAREVIASFVHSSPLRAEEGRVTMTAEMLNLQWEKMSLYPAGHYVRRIGVTPSVTLPTGWRAASALTGAVRSGNTIIWDRTDYETLVDSPIFAGAYFQQWSIGNAVRINAVADNPAFLTLKQDQLAAMSRLVDEALLTFGRAPYDRYEFLVALSDRIGPIGLEHLKSSENQLEPRNFYRWDDYDWDRNVLAHELVHSWNGKYRRPARLWTPDYRTAMQDNLLWVYEGQTHFWGWVLAARSGLQSKEMVLGIMADSAGRIALSPGREWRPLADTTLDPLISARKPKPYTSYARNEDYYVEGALIWLEADQIIRAGTKGKKGLDQFARAFFSRSDSKPRVNRYEAEDVFAALNRVYAYDWASFFQKRIDRPGQPAPLTGLQMAGYRLVWKDEPNPYTEARMDHTGKLNLQGSLGLAISKDGKVSTPRWGGPAFNASIVTGATIVAVDKVAYSPEGLKQTITRAAKDKRPIELLVRRGSRFDTVMLPYTDGLRWPWLERINGKRTAPLDRLLTPRSR